MPEPNRRHLPLSATRREDAEVQRLRACGVSVGDATHFAGEPLILISPTTQDGWLAERLAQFGPTPCAFLLGSRDLDASRERCRLGEVQSWGDVSVAWFDGDPLLGRWLGVVAV